MNKFSSSAVDEQFCQEFTAKDEVSILKCWSKIGKKSRKHFTDLLRENLSAKSNKTGFIRIKSEASRPLLTQSVEMFSKKNIRWHKSCDVYLCSTFGMFELHFIQGLGKFMGWRGCKTKVHEQYGLIICQDANLTRKLFKTVSNLFLFFKPISQNLY